VPERLVGWPIRLYPNETRMLAEPYGRLPMLGGLSNNTANVEEIARIRPDLVMLMASGTVTEMATRAEERTGIPVYVIDMTLKTMPHVYDVLGDLFGAQARAKELGDYCRTTIDEIERVVKTIPPGRRPRVYNANGVTGLQTFPAGAPHAEPIEFAGGVNVADSPVSLAVAQVSMEQLAAWNPQIIVIVGDRASGKGALAEAIKRDPVWRSLPAVRNGAVYDAPRAPFNWIDPPWSVNRVLGLKWLATLFHPDRFHYDMRAEARRFYTLFYHRMPTDSELDELLAGALPGHARQ
jgi:iron complex transport system substrate-binding protein